MQIPTQQKNIVTDALIEVSVATKTSYVGINIVVIMYSIMPGVISQIFVFVVSSIIMAIPFLIGLLPIRSIILNSYPFNRFK